MSVLLCIMAVFHSIVVLNAAPLSACVDQQQCFQLIQGSQEGLITLKFMYSFPACCALKNGQIDSNGICTVGNDEDLLTDHSITNCGTSQPYFTFIAKDSSKCESPPTNPISVASSTTPLSATCYLNPDGCNTQQNCEDHVGGTWINGQCYCSQNDCSNPIDPTVCLRGCQFTPKTSSSSTTKCDVSCLCPSGVMEPKACAWKVSVPPSWCPAGQIITHSNQRSNNDVAVVDLEEHGNSQDSVVIMEWRYIGIIVFCVICCVVATYWYNYQQRRNRMRVQLFIDASKEMIDDAMNEDSYSTF